MKPPTFWYGKPSNYDCETAIQRATSLLEQNLNYLTEFIMDDRWISVSRKCAILVDSSFKLWTVFTFAMLSIALLFYEVSISVIIFYLC